MSRMCSRVVAPIHHDGLGLNDLIEIRSDGPDEKNGSGVHAYFATMDVSDQYHGPSTAGLAARGLVFVTVAEIQFQHGPRTNPGSEPGVTEAVIYAILIDRLESFQDGPFACEENAEQLEHLRACLRITRERAEKRRARGVLGTLTP